MKRLISFLSSFIILLNTCSGYMLVEKDIKKEEIISFNFSNDEDELLEYIDVSEYENVKIVDYGMNNGEAIIELEDDYLILDLFDGKYSNGKEIRKKVKTEEIENIIAKNKKAYFEPDAEVKSIVDVDGDFESAILKNGQIVLTLGNDAVGVEGYDENELVTSEITIEVPVDNSEKNVYSDYYTLGYIPQSVEIKDVKLEADADIEIEDNKIRLLFKNGIPEVEETSRSDTHSYFWVDRAIDGSFRERYPNSIYRSDREYFEGKGEYIDDERLIMDIDFLEGWQDYVGFVLDGQRYIYPLTKNFSKDFFEDAIIMKNNSIDFEGNWFNTQELTVEITDDTVRYIPKGTLYSMGELVENTEGWGITEPNKSHESTETFFNPITGKDETYVKHFKFYYGPSKKETFGGNFKYPYKATLEYEHYKPVTLYSGSVTYEYEELEDVSGYLFDGWVKISYTEKEDVKDYPPSAPYNVFYNNLEGKLTWAAAKDDYTSKDDLVYEIEVKLSEEFQKISETVGITNLDYQNGKDYEYRVRTKDELGQASEWAYSNDCVLEVIGELKPSVVKAGDTIDISAIVKSLNEVEDVYAVSEELKLNERLIKNSEKLSNATEISFNLLNYTGKEPWLIVDDMSYAQVNSNKDVKIKTYYSYSDTEGKTIGVELPLAISFTDNGTIILPNQNYTDIPIEISSFNGDLWYFYSMCNLKFVNKNTEKEEIFIQFVNDTKASLVGRREKIEVTPYIKINLFEYINGTPTYEEIPINSDIATKPISVTWTSENGTTKFNIYVDNTHFYSYEIETHKLKENIKEFSTYSIGKSMDRMLRNSVGYQYHYKSKYYNWVNMYKSDSLLNIPFLGYKVQGKLESSINDEYNNLPNLRDVYRMVFMDEAISLNVIEEYLTKIKTTNLVINRKDKETVFVDDIQEIMSEFSKEKIKIPSNAKIGTYEVVILAVDKMGNQGMAVLPLIVEENKIPIINKEDIKIGRFYYVDNNINKKAVEELALTKHNLDTEGFISAGETLAIVIDDEFEVENIVIDIEGDSSIKECDKLTEMFLGESVKVNYSFPLTIYPNEDGVFRYIIPYGTKQSLESWSTLRKKSDDYEGINKDLLFTRSAEPYKLNIYINGDEENVISFDFDVFERWDTVLNRDASKYIINSGTRWRIML